MYSIVCIYSKILFALHTASRRDTTKQYLFAIEIHNMRINKSVS